MSETVWVMTEYAIQQYAAAVENTDPVFFDADAAEKIGFSRPIAPTSFCGQYQMFLDPGAKVPKGGVHTRHKMSFFHPICAGDYIYARTEAVSGKDAKGRPLLTYVTRFVNQNGVEVCRGEMTNLLPSNAK